MAHKNCKKKLTGYETWPEREKIIDERKKRAGKQVGLGEFENENQEIRKSRRN